MWERVEGFLVMRVRAVSQSLFWRAVVREDELDFFFCFWERNWCRRFFLREAMEAAMPMSDDGRGKVDLCFFNDGGFVFF